MSQKLGPENKFIWELLVTELNLWQICHRFINLWQICHSRPICVKQGEGLKVEHTTFLRRLSDRPPTIHISHTSSSHALTMATTPSIEHHRTENSTLSARENIIILRLIDSRVRLWAFRGIVMILSDIGKAQIHMLRPVHMVMHRERYCWRCDVYIIRWGGRRLW